MPRTYKCRQCKEVHEPPTGKQCNRGRAEIDVPGDNTQQQILRTLADLQRQMTEMRDDIANGASAEVVEDSPDDISVAGEEPVAGACAPAVRSGGESATPDSLRQNIQLMAQAANRIAQLGIDDQDDEELVQITRARKQGKKSGSLMVPTDVVKNTIDWPHMHVRRMANGVRKTVTFKELKVEEFVAGYLTMLASPQCTMDKEVMIDILRMVMTDAVDFSWGNARGFYEILGHAVEEGTLNWVDTHTVREYRMHYSRAVFPEVKEQKEQKEGARPQPKQAPSGMKCCAAFQTQQCEQSRDHIPFTHACAYCFRTCSLMCRHPEKDCIRKSADESKNGKKREA